MKPELVRSSHCVGEANYHLQFTPAYRCPIFADELTKLLTRDYILAAAKRYGISIAAIVFGADHCHIFAAECKNRSPAEAAKLLKGFSARMMRKHHYALIRSKLKKRFWSAGYFYRTVGAVDNETIEHYVSQAQEKHWRCQRGQRKLLEFGAK